MAKAKKPLHHHLEKPVTPLVGYFALLAVAFVLFVLVYYLKMGAL